MMFACIFLLFNLLLFIAAANSCNDWNNRYGRIMEGEHLFSVKNQLFKVVMIFTMYKINGTTYSGGSSLLIPFKGINNSSN